MLDVNIMKHIPVLLNETIDLLHLQEGMSVVDGTLGLGGHSSEILKRIGKKGRLMGFDQDKKNLNKAKAKLQKSEYFNNNLIFVHQNFENLAENLKKYNFKPDAILLDLGFSSPHVDEADRGFSFQNDGPLDMRYDQRQKLTAEIVINEAREKELANIIYEYGEEPKSRLIARKIIEKRKKNRITNTKDLAEIVSSTMKYKKGKHPATQTFQALRIYVNRELEVLKSTLKQSIKHLTIGGHIAVIAYHSLEDRIIKNTFRYYAKDCICPHELPICQCNFKKKLYLLNKRPIIPKGIEVEMNPRARSAKLRVAKRI